MPLSPALSQACFRRDGWRCRHCNSSDGLHPHHVIYKSQGGTDTLDNLLTLCHQCHMDGIHAGRLVVYVIELKPKDLVVRFIRVRGWKPR